MGMAEDLTNLGEEMLASFDARINFLGQNIVDVKKHAADTQKFLSTTRREQAKAAGKLHANLEDFVCGLAETVEEFQERCHKEQKVRQRETRAAGQAFKSASKAMAQRRKQFNTRLSQAKQKAKLRKAA